MTDPFDKFYFNGDTDFLEYIEDYKPGGFHPVHLGDRFPTHDNPRYQVLHKLGCGSSSTVWLAKDTVANLYVALKIVVARLTGVSREAAILERLNTSLREHPGTSHIVQLHDYFQILGPNGIHQVLVMDVLAPAFLLHRNKGSCQQSRSICHQLLLELEYLRQEGVVHGDLHFENIGFKIPGIDQYSEDEILNWIGYPRMVPIVPRDLLVQRDSLPRYLILDGDITSGMFKSATDDLNVRLFAQIMDFGTAFWVHDEGPSRPFRLPMLMDGCLAPELMLYKLSDCQVTDKWGLPSDVWSMACTIFQIVNKTKLFQDRSGHDWVYHAMKLVGPLPERWKPYLHSKESQAEGDLIMDPDAEWHNRIKWLPNDRLVYLDPVAEFNTFMDFLRAMLRWEPMDRPTTADMLQHSWFSRLDQAAWLFPTYNVQ